MGKRRLGRGLDALLGRTHREPEPEEDSTDLVYLHVRQIDRNPFQPRQDFDPVEMAGLVESILQHGVIQPILVRMTQPRGTDPARYQLVAGERRLRAAIEAGLQEVPARVMELDDRQVSELAIVENLQRRDLNPLEKAQAFQDYLTRFGGTQEDLAVRLNVDRSTITNLMRLLELPAEVRDALRWGKITASHARALLPVADEGEQVELCRRIVDEGLSVRQVEAIANGDRGAYTEQWGGRPADLPAHARKARGHRRDAGATDGEDGGEGGEGAAGPTRHVVELEQRLREALGSRVEIRLRGKERGRIVVYFESNDEFERLMEHITGRGSEPAARAPGDVHAAHEAHAMEPAA